MPIPSLVTFKSQTKLDSKEHFFTSYRGKSISKIDNLLALYHKKGPMDISGKAQVLSMLLMECATWLKAKAGKQSRSTLGRRFPIEQLARCAFMELKGFEKASAIDRFNLNKAVNTRNGFATKPLFESYAQERTQYINSSEKKRDRVQPIQGPSLAYGFHKVQDEREIWLKAVPSEEQRQRLRTMLNKNDWGELTLEEIDMLRLIFERGMKRELDQVRFLTKEERANQFMVVFKGDNHDFEKPTGGPFDTMDYVEGLYMYVVDAYGNLFASKPGQGGRNDKGKEYNWNHSSFNAGKDVVCAGNIKIVNGTLQYIDTDSGHYRPRRGELYSLLNIFEDERINLKNTKVKFIAGKESVVMAAEAFLMEGN